MKKFIDIESLMIFQSKLSECPIEAFITTNETKKSKCDSNSNSCGRSSSNHLTRTTSMINQTARNISLMI